MAVRHSPFDPSTGVEVLVQGEHVSTPSPPRHLGRCSAGTVAWISAVELAGAEERRYGTRRVSTDDRRTSCRRA